MVEWGGWEGRVLWEDESFSLSFSLSASAFSRRASSCSLAATFFSLSINSASCNNVSTLLVIKAICIL